MNGSIYINRQGIRTQPISYPLAPKKIVALYSMLKNALPIEPTCICELRLFIDSNILGVEYMLLERLIMSMSSFRRVNKSSEDLICRLNDLLCRQNDL